MTSIFIQELRRKHLEEQNKIKARRQSADRIIETTSKGIASGWGMIQDIKEKVAPITDAVTNSKDAHQEFMSVAEKYGLGGDTSFYNHWEEVLGDRYNDPYYKRMLSIALEYTLKKKEQI